jgi:hypothetical protein
MKKGFAVFFSLIPPRKKLTHKKFPPGISDYIMHDILLLPACRRSAQMSPINRITREREKRQTVDFRFMF